MLPEKFPLSMFRAFSFRRPATPESAAICSLPRGERTGRLLGLRFMQTNQVMQATFYFVAFQTA
ncbi:hypothetical protein NEIFLAOT_01140 [Neisseria flavescens NRL30031/H210]|uniref:Uncharacterized protein n=1 Tax=Neisseria flavescens NRL30031/H210 TaxID=546264 RepID=C0EMG9_NEIFL|nr:hypothetical protein NEIFLAOT_01140 [Neisseria flavescens NRL30031/H210]